MVIDKMAERRKEHISEADDDRELTALRVQITHMMNPKASEHGILHPFLYLSADELREAKEAWTAGNLVRVRELCDLARTRYP